jgi:protein disulfide-isomerase A6
MKPAWEKLEKEYASSKTLVIGNVDCTADNAKALCQEYGVQGYPTIRYFTSATATQGDNYEGGREYADLAKFAASDTFGPKCGNDNMDLCSAEQKAFLDKANAMTPEDRAKEVATKASEFKAIESDFKNAVEALQAKYQELMKEKETKEEAFKSDNPFLGLLKAFKDPPHAEL